jgi:hypothetical protein
VAYSHGSLGRKAGRNSGRTRAPHKSPAPPKPHQSSVACQPPRTMLAASAAHLAHNS